MPSNLIIPSTQKSGVKKKRRPSFRPANNNARKKSSKPNKAPLTVPSGSKAESASTLGDNDKQQLKSNLRSGTPNDVNSVIASGQKEHALVATATASVGPSVLKNSKQSVVEKATAKTAGNESSLNPPPVSTRNNRNTSSSPSVGHKTEVKSSSGKPTPKAKPTGKRSSGKKRKMVGVGASLAVGASKKSIGIAVGASKKLGVAVGASRATKRIAGTTEEAAAEKSSSSSQSQEWKPKPTENANENESPKTDLAALLEAQKQSDAKSMSSFCSKFKVKRRKKSYKTGAQRKVNIKNERNDRDNGDDLSAARSTPPPSGGPVVQIIDGQIVLQESSMLVGAGTSIKPDENHVVEEDTQLASIGASYHSFAKYRSPKHWTTKETTLFYEALRQVGVDFGTMVAYFGETRTRKQLKRKYMVEQTKNPKLIEKALDPRARKQMDLSVFEVKAEDIPAEAASKRTTIIREETLTNDGREGNRDVGKSDAEQLVVDETEEFPNAAEKSMPSFKEEEPEEERVLQDPLFNKEAVEEDIAAPISLVSTTLGGKKKKLKKKPKFRSRKLKAK